MKTLEFIVPGEPIGKGRPRFARGRVYTPQKTKDYEDLVAYHAKKSGAIARELPVSIYIECQYRIPKSYTNKRREEIRNNNYHTNKPDLDNSLKIISDGLNGIAWKDDCQIFSAQIVKKYTFDDPYTTVRIQYV